DAYRGAGRPEATYSIERVIDKAAHELGLDPLAIRRQNFIQPDQYPYTTPVGLIYDTGNYNATLDKLIEIGDLAGFEKRAAASKAKGKLRGLGLSTWIEACGIAPSNLVGVLGARVGLYDAATVRVNATGNISVMTGAHSHGQGHETVFPQIVADMLGIPAASVDIVHGDTSKIPFGMGSYGSRSLAVCGTAIVKAVDKIIAKGKKIAAHMLEASEGDIEFKDGKFSVAGTDKAKSFGEIAFSAYVPHNYPLETLEPGLEETAFYDPANFTYPAGAYACEVEVDPETGRVTIEKFTCADDFGNVMNPLIVAGQVHGGVGQGIGQALLENVSYDANGQLLSGSFMDYAMPRADDVPFYTVDHSCNTPCTHNPLGVKGCGEAGAIGSPPAVVNAVVNALQRGGHSHVTHIEMPVSPSRVWAAMNA
ncbi:MAG: xanthine dehydrogenase family protein molybdopterin-binding subunit, partial [Paracoccaceae bacterium]